MSAVRDSLADYLQIRRALGYKLRTQAYLLSSFVSYLEQGHATTVTTELAVAWATQPTDAPMYWSQRLSVVRTFATYLRTIDPTTQVPPRGVLPAEVARPRATPFLYSDQELAGLLQATRKLSTPLRAVTHQTLICLLAATGMRMRLSRSP
jgi:integrase/recombinase XerD